MNTYRRWRLHNGSFQSYYEQFGREGLVEFLSPWWTSWAQLWTVHLQGNGFCDLYSDIRTAKGFLSDETIEAVKAAILTKDTDKGLVDMIITRQEPNIENCGCVWTGNGILHHDTISDIVNWVLDCEGCEDETSYIEPSGFIYHLGKSQKKNPDTVHPSFLENFATTSAQTVSTVAKESMSQLADLVNISTFGFFGSKPATPVTAKPRDPGPSDDLADSRFMVGLEGGMEDEESDKPAEVFTSDTDLYSELIPEDEIESGRINLSYKKLYLRLAESSTTVSTSDQSSIEDSPQPTESSSLFEQYNVIIYRRRPFVFTLLYKTKSSVLSNKSYYQSLHRRLASLSVPIYTDLTSPNRGSPVSEGSSHQSEASRSRAVARPRSSSSASKSKTGQNAGFYYHVYDPNLHKVQYSLPEIPSLEYILELEQEGKDGGTVAQKADFDRSELIHVHQSMIHISIACSHKGDKEKFIRTARSWWVYWSKLPDGRQVVFARKWTKPGKPPMESVSSGLLGVLGNDAKLWLDGYKHFGKV